MAFGRSSRRFLFVCGNDRAIMEKAKDFATDVMGVDPEDSVPSQGKDLARELVRKFLERSAPDQGVYLRLSSPSIENVKMN